MKLSVLMEDATLNGLEEKRVSNTISEGDLRAPRLAFVRMIIIHLRLADTFTSSLIRNDLSKHFSMIVMLSVLPENGTSK